MIIDFMIAMLLVYLCAASLVRLARRQFGLVVYNWIAAVAWALGESGTCLEIPFKRVYYRRASFSTWTSLQYQVIVYCLATWSTEPSPAKPCHVACDLSCSQATKQLQQHHFQHYDPAHCI